MKKVKTDWSDEFVYHWKDWPRPARSSPSDLDFIRKKIIDKGKNVKVLVLGSTPEYREMCGNLGVPVTCFDFSRKNFEYLKGEVLNPPKERFIEGNWLTKEVSEKFDIILGDAVINVLRKKEVSIFMSNISRLLSNDGLFMPRTYIRTADETKPEVEKGIKEYREKKHIYGLYAGLSRVFYLGGYGFKKDESYMKDWYKSAEKMFKKGLLTRKELDFFGNVLTWKDRKFQFSMPIDQELNKIILQFFDIADVVYGTEPYLDDKYPLYVLKVKR